MASGNILNFNDLYNSPNFPNEYKYDRKDFVFVLLSLLDVTMAESFRLASSKDYPLTDLSIEGNSERWKKINSNSSSSAQAMFKREGIVALGKFMRPIVNTYIKDYVAKHPETFEYVTKEKYENLHEQISNDPDFNDDISPEEFRKILVKNIRLLNGDPEFVKELMQLMKLYSDKVLKDSGDENDTDKTIILTYPKKEGICPNCNREIDVLYTARFECPYCKQWLDLRKENPMY